MKVLIAFEKSGIAREEFKKRGHDVISCDLLPTDKPGLHVTGDIKDWLQFSNNVGIRYDLIIAHPPCTYLCNSGVRWLYANGEYDWKRWGSMRDAANLFRLILQFPVDKIAVENPIMHKHAVNIIGRRQDQIIQPWQFGHGETKATCLWLKGLPKLEPTNTVEGREARIHKMPPGPKRAEMRSISYQGIMKAMADQWG